MRRISSNSAKPSCPGRRMSPTTTRRYRRRCTSPASAEPTARHPKPRALRRMVSRRRISSSSSTTSTCALAAQRRPYRFAGLAVRCRLGRGVARSLRCRPGCRACPVIRRFCADCLFNHCPCLSTCPPASGVRRSCRHAGNGPKVKQPQTGSIGFEQAVEHLPASCQDPARYGRWPAASPCAPGEGVCGTAVRTMRPVPTRQASSVASA